MSEVKAQADLLNELAEIASDSPVVALRNQRAEINGFIQASYDALLEPVDEAGVSRVERGLIALRVAVLERSSRLIHHYRAYLAQQKCASESIAAVEKEGPVSAPFSPRQIAILAHTDRLTNEPRVATPEDLYYLKAQGLTDAELVTISQLIAFLSFQVRAIAGLQLLAEAQ